MPTELKNIRVDFLSLVAKGANKKKIIYKADGTNGGKPEGAEEIEFVAKSLKKSDERQMVYAPVYSPDEVDTQGEFAKAAEIEAAAYGFMKSRNVLNVDADHDFDPKAAFVAESWIVKGVDSVFPDEPVGTWCVGIKVDDADLWARVKKGELEGISMAGCAVKIRKEEGGGILGKLEELLNRVLKTKEEPTAKAEGTTDDDKAIDELVAKIAKAVKDDVGADLSKKYDDLAAKFEALEKSTSGKQSNGVDNGSENYQGCGIA